ncbi:MAG: hypothetical protein ACKO8Z_06700 [Prosthecobacter sp.]
MKIIHLSLLGALLASTAAMAQTQLDESEVKISYAELKRLLAASQPVVELKVKPPPPVPAALLSAVYRLDAKTGGVIAEMQTQNFVDGWQSIPLAGASKGAASLDPEDACVVVLNDRLCLLMGQTGLTSLKLTFSAVWPQTLDLAPSAVTALEVTELPEGHVVRLSNGFIIRENGRYALPAAGGAVTLTLEDAKKQAATLADEAILNSAIYATQVTRDGSMLTEGTLLVRHDSPMRIVVTLPESAQLLQLRVNDALIHASIQSGTRLEIPLNASAGEGDESKIELSFTSTLPALQPTEGELNLALPQTPLFAKQIDWQVHFPVGFDTTATGSIETLPPAADAKPGLYLRKSLCRNQQPQARINYRKRTN